MADDQKLFLGTGHVRVAHYGGGSSDFEVIRLVRGKDHEDAKAKFDSAYTSKTRPYEATYTVIDSDVSDVIE